MNKTYIRQGIDGLYMIIVPDNGPEKAAKFPERPPQAAKAQSPHDENI